MHIALIAAASHHEEDVHAFVGVGEGHAATSPHDQEMAAVFALEHDVWNGHALAEHRATGQFAGAVGLDEFLFVFLHFAGQQRRHRCKQAVEICGSVEIDDGGLAGQLVEVVDFDGGLALLAQEGDVISRL